MVMEGRLRREAFLFASEGQQLFASLYHAPGASGSGVLVCPSWGFEMAQTLQLCHGLAREVAGLGGAGMVVHWPGHGESDGEVLEADVPRMAAAATDAVVAGRARTRLGRWGLAGIRLGAAAAWEAARTSGAEMLVLLQPSLNPAAFLRDLTARTRRAGLGRGRPGWAFGELLPDAGAWPDRSLVDLDERFAGAGACIRYADDPGGCPTGMEEVLVRGSWRRELLSGYRGLLRPATSWIRSMVGAHG